VGKVVYSKYLLFYLDILGFKEAVRHSMDDQIRIKRISDVLELARRIVSAANRTAVSPRLRTRMFSDTILLTCRNPSAADVIGLYQLASHIQILLVRQGYFLRGAAVVDDHYEKGDVMFGPAIIRALEMERLASWPRILIHPEVVHMRPSSEGDDTPLRLFWPARDQDGMPYIDYLTQAFMEETILNWSLEMWNERVSPIPEIDFLSTHKYAMLAQINSETVKSDLSKLAKYHALATYHNSVIDKLCSYIPDSFDSTNIEPSTPWGRMRLLFGLSLILQAVKWPPDKYPPEEMVKMLRRKAREVLKPGYSKRKKTAKDESEHYTVPADVPHIPNDKVWEFLDAKLSELCKQKGVLEDKQIDLPAVFPALYNLDKSGK